MTGLKGFAFAAALLCCLSTAPAGQPTTILAAAAASLQYSFVDEIIPGFREKYPWIEVEGTYDGSGKLQAQIENGLDADVFMSASTRQMDALVEKGFVDADDVTNLLENRIVLIRPSFAETPVTGFADIARAETIALGDPASVPAGQYAKQALTNLGVWEAAAAKASFGTNVAEVLNWVAEGSADVGVVYATDAAATDRVRVVAPAPEGSLDRKVTYPVGVLKRSRDREAAALFVEYLASEAGLAVFSRYGFSPL